MITDSRPPATHCFAAEQARNYLGRVNVLEFAVPGEYKLDGSQISASAAALVAMAASPDVFAQSAGGVKLTILLGQPKNPEDFERYYLSTHIPMVAAVKGIRRIETAKGVPGADGSAPLFYRIFEAWFDCAEQFASITASPEWARVRADTAKIAPEGFTRLISRVD